MSSSIGFAAAIPIATTKSSVLRSTRAGALSDSTFGQRHRGTGNVADLIADTFHVWKKKLGLDAELPPLNCEAFEPPQINTGQRRLF